MLFLVAHFHCVRFARNKVSPQMILSLSSLSSDDAKLWLGISELALIVSAIVLVVGLLGEWPDSESWKNRTLYKLSKAAVILGVFGELLGDAGIFETSARLQVLEESAISVANTKAAAAEVAAGQAKERAGALENTAAQLRLDLEKERVKNQTRPLTQKEFDAIGELKGKIPSVSLAYSSNCIECSVYATQIVDALMAANIDVKLFLSQSTLGAWHGLSVQYPDFPDENIVVETLRKSDLLAATSKLAPETTRIPGVPMDRPLLLIGERFPEVNPDTWKILLKGPIYVLDPA